MSDNEDDDDEIIGEIEMIFTPRLEALASRGIMVEDFEVALVLALEGRQGLAALEDVDDEEIPPLEEMTLEIEGVTYKVEDLADIEIKDDED